MKILFKQAKTPELIEKTNSIADAIRYSGGEAGFNNMAMLDALYEYKPDKYITYENPSDEEKYACDKYSVELIKAEEKCVANIFRYKPVPKLKSIEVDEVCINDYGSHVDLMKWLSKDNKKTFRLFQQELLAFDCYCGWISPDYHSLILSCAEQVICTTIQSYYNHLLSNENCILIDKFKSNEILTSAISPRQAILQTSTCFHAAFDFIGNDALVGLEKYTCK